MKPLAGLLFLTLCTANAWGQVVGTEPSIGYVYPAGGRQGTVVQITIGGQNLQGVSRAYVSGQGVSATDIQYVPPLNRMQLDELKRRIIEIRDKRLTELAAQRGIPPNALEQMKRGLPIANPGTLPDPAKPVVLPNHPLLRNLDNLSLQDLKKVADMFLNPNRKQQVKRSIQEMAIMDVTISADAPPEDRELRLRTPAGFTNPMCFQVGVTPEISEQKPNDPDSPAAPAVNLPILLNGQIMPGDIDCFYFKAHKGQNLVIQAQARHLIPYMPDAVPGWFQAAITLYDANNRELAFADHYRFSPDPVIFYHVPQDGEYMVEIRDSIYRGREDFVYRLFVGEDPFITQMFPLGGKTGVATTASIAGWNLSKNRLPLDTRPGVDSIRQTALRGEKWSNRVLYAVDDLPESVEIEPNDTMQNAPRITLPQIVNGRIGKPGDVDLFQFEGRAGFEFVAEVFARRLDSPLDSLLRLTDASGRVLAWNDDNEDKGTGLNTHHADSYLFFKLPQDGVYYVQLSDAQNHGGEEYAYRLRIGPRSPDFALRVTPSSINVPAGCAVPISVYALRRNGFDGDIEVALKDAPAGWVLSGGLIPAGKDCVRMTLTAPKEPTVDPVVLRMESRATINGKPVSHPAVPAEDMMQAFAYRHLVPAETLMAAILEAKPRTPVFELSENGPINIPADGTAQVRARIPPRMQFITVSLELSEPPKGVSLGEVNIAAGVLTFTLKADGKEVQPGFADNLIVEAFTEWPAGPPDDKGVRPKRRVSLGVLPAISIKIAPH